LLFKCAAKNWLCFVLILFCFSLIGRGLGFFALRESPDISLLISQSKQSPMICDGNLLDDPDYINNRWRFDVRLKACRNDLKSESKSVKGVVRLYTNELVDDFEKGDEIRFQGKFKEPREFKNPGTFNYTLYLKTKGVDAIGSLSGSRWIVKLSDSPGVFHKLRRYIASSIDKAHAGVSGEIVKALAIGERNKISSDMRDIFSRTGTAHILAISGLHVGFVAFIIFLLSWGLLGWFPSLIMRFPIPYIASLITLPAIWCYIAIADFPVSAVRAGVMLSVFILSYVSLKYRYDLISALFTAVFVILLLSPIAAFSVSFRFSVLAVLVIITIVPILYSKINLKDNVGGVKKVLIYFARVCIVSFVATLGTAPLVAYYFHYLTGMGFISNLVVVPMVGFVIMPIVLVAFLVNLFSVSLSIYLWSLAGYVASFMLYFLKAVNSHLSFLVIRWSPTVGEVFLALAGIIIIIFWKKIPYRRLALILFGIFVLSDAAYWHVLPKITGNLEVRFLDVGQGDSIFVRFPNGNTALIDGGGLQGSEFDVGKNIISPALLRMGIYSVDYLFLTHPHYDHYAGLASIAENFHPKILYTNGLASPSEEKEYWSAFLDQINKSGALVYNVYQEGAEPALLLREGDVNINVYVLPENIISDYDLNDSSLVTHIVYKQKSILLTGDLTKKGEQEMMHAKFDLKSNVLKVGHHGSDTSSGQDFLEYVDPDYAVITVGENNRYGMPDEAVLSRLNQEGAKIYRTDLDGMVTLKTNGDDIDVESFVER